MTNPEKKEVNKLIAEVTTASLKNTHWKPGIENELVPITVVVELIVATQSQQHAKARPQREEYLRGCSRPDLRKMRGVESEFGKLVKKRHTSTFPR